MTGEMHYIDPETGIDSNGDCWPVHLAIAKAVNGTLKPFDVYQGPYIAIGKDLTIGNAPYAIPVNFPGIVRLWVSTDENGDAIVYREDTDKFEPFFFDDEQEAINAAMELLKC